MEVATVLARRAGETLMSTFGAIEALEMKGEVDLVSEADRASERLLVEGLLAAFPEDAILGEEGGVAGSPEGRFRWVLDPLDGTTNFVHGYPLVTVSIGLAVGKKLVLGVVYNPLMDELCSAVTGRGTHLNGRRVHVGTATGVTTALVCNNIGASRNPEVNATPTRRLLALLQANIRGLRNSGSAAQNMMHVACGRLDAYFEDGFGGPWDVAAGHVLIEEAGGVCAHHLGGSFQLMAGKGQVLCGNKAVVEDIARVLKSVEQ